ncbi:hypothetical protein DS421_6g189040 [Arachis hypogaea]|nr:hypothetical protein DS421_6g189040 [Arachis hypogaea]
MVIRKFKFEDPCIEQIQDIDSDMIRYFREDLYRRFLSVDFKKQVDGLEMLCVGLIQLFNEKEVYKVSIGAACNFLWAVDRLVIQVLDDSTEPAIKIIDDALKYSGIGCNWTLPPYGLPLFFLV